MECCSCTLQHPACFQLGWLHLGHLDSKKLSAKCREGLGAKLEIPALGWYFLGMCSGSCTLVPASCQD